MTTPAHGSAAWASVSPVDSLLLIVDGHAYAYRAFHAIRHLNAPDGAPTNAIYGFIKMLARMRAQVRPTHLAVIWDGGLAAERTEALPGYKAQRPPMPDALASQMDGMVEFLKAAGLTSYCQDGVEADDWIARAARGAVQAGARAVIASSDKDFMQLVAAPVGLLNPNDKSERIWTAAEVREKTGVEPEQIVDWLSLIGDSVDNIPGVPGVGPKTATALLQRFGSVARLYERLPEVESDRLRASLDGARGAVMRNQVLVKLREDVGEPFNLAATLPAPEDIGRLLELYSRWGFRTLRQELEARRGPAQGELL
ncbi:MAG: flap endonuclease [Proteobacteria bacterium]|nr:flap endonuclease [Pseudomonadota bacterium]